MTAGQLQVNQNWFRWGWSLASHFVSKRLAHRARTNEAKQYRKGGGKVGGRKEGEGKREGTEMQTDKRQRNRQRGKDRQTDRQIQG